MTAFLQRFGPDVIGEISGFDRIVLRGHIRQLSYLEGMKAYMGVNQVRTMDFREHARELTKRLGEAIETPVRLERRHVEYLNSTKIDKEALAQSIAARDKVREGTICLLSCVEPCRTFEVHRNREKKTLELRPVFGKCTFFYKYRVHPQLGYIHARIQSWFPFSTQVYINGREWLSRQLDLAGLQYRRVDNTFVWLEDLPQAQSLLMAQLRTNWPTLLEEIITDLNPLYGPDWLQKFRAPYYWSTYQVEWATDVLFKAPETLARLYPPLALHSIRTLGCTDLLRFYDRGSRFSGDARGRLVQRHEGLRIKHAVDGNSLKAYDKAYANAPGEWSVLRIEATTTNPKGYKAFRATGNDPTGPKQWLPMRKGIADLHRVAQVSQAANERYAGALVAADCSESVGALAASLTRSITHDGRRLRGLRPWADDDLALLRAVADGEHLLNGLRNRDLRERLYSKPPDGPKEQRQRSAQASRTLRLLRAHGIVKKVPKTHRYQVTEFGRKALTALLTAIGATTSELVRLAA